MKKSFGLMLLAAVMMLLPAAMAQAAAARDYISIVGSSTVYPFATVVAEQFGRGSQYKTPKIESTGSGGGLKLFAAGIGVEHPDITNASRRIKVSEFELCKKNGIDEILEIKIGYDGIVVANSKSAKQLKLDRKTLFLALAKEIPNPKDGEHLIANPYKTWQDIDRNLPAIAIKVLGPPPTSGTRDAFVELAMGGGAQQYPWLKALSKSDKKEFKKIAYTIREDGAYIEAGENDNLIVQKLDADHGALGIFGFSFLDQNADKLQGSLIDGVEPTFANIADSSYPVSRPLYFYVKKAHINVIPGMKGYLAEFTSDKAFGEDGYLSDRGLIPMPKEERLKYQAVVNNLGPALCAADFK